MLQAVEAGIGNTSGAAPTAKILRLPDRAARGAPDGGDRAPGGAELVRTFLRAAHEAAGGSCAQPVEMRPLARRLGLDPKAVENLAVRLQAERLVRVVSMANGLLRLTPEGTRAAEGAAESASSDPPESVGSGQAAPASPVVGRGALRSLGEMLGPLKADLDRLDLVGALDGEQRSELAAEVRTIEAQLGSPRPKRRIVAAALESVGEVAGSAAGTAGGAGSETGSEKILRAVDAFLDGTAPEVGGAAGGAAGKAQAGRTARGTPRGARNGAGPARPGSDPADEDGSGARRPEAEGKEEGSAATAREREAGGVRIRKRVRDDGGRATERARDAGRPAGEGADGAVGDAREGAGSAVEGVGEGADQASWEAEAGRRVLRIVDPSGDVIRTTLNGDGEILDEAVVGHVAVPPAEGHPDDGGRVAGRAVDQAAGTAEGIAPNPHIPGGRTLGEERRTVRRTMDEPGCITIQSTLDGSGNVLDEKIVGRQ